MKFLLYLCAVFWLLASVGGVFYLAKYENTATEKDVVYPKYFPSESHINRDADHLTLIFFAHPKCPCTRASLRELSRLLTDTNGKLQAYVVFFKPKEAGEEWTATDLRAKAEAIPNVKVLIDENERETKIFNAQTSGLILLYDGNGELRFNGGITSARGHEGDNAGSRAIFEIVNKESGKNSETFVFGCPLHKKECHGELMQNAQ